MNAAARAEALPPAPLPPALNARLSTMMFLQYAIWGAWLPLLWPFLSGHRGLAPSEIGDMFAVGAVGAIVAPFIAGQIADRWFSTEKFLGLSHLAGAVLVWELAEIESYGAFLGFSLAYSLIYSPTLSLTNSLAFHHLPDRDRDFGKVRVWGTVGWIAVGIAIGQWLLRAHTPAGADVDVVQAAQFAGMGDAFRLSALLGAAMGLYCFTLPSTPPSVGERKSAVAEALVEIRRQPLLTLFLLAVPISCIHQFYFVHTAGFLGAFQSQTAAAINDVFGVGGAGLMTLGQMCEIAVLAAMPLLAVRLSRKFLLVVGTCAYALRMYLFAHVEVLPFPPVATLIAGVLLHGFCFGCWIFVAFMIVDEQTTPDVRASAQSLFNLVIVGIGVIVGSKIATGVAEWATDASGALDYHRLFEVPMWGALGCLAVLLFLYPGGRRVGVPAVAALLPLALVLLPACLSPHGERLGAPPSAPNTLSPAEAEAGWELLFDGRSTAGWRGFRRPDFPEGWVVVDGCLEHVQDGGDIITTGQYEDFELRLQWAIDPGGNSGIFFHVDEALGAVWETGPEMQVLDNAGHADGANPLTSAGANYALHAPVRDVTRPPGEFNQVRLVVDDGRVEHWLNGVLLLRYQLGGPDWQARVAASKFAGMPDYGRRDRGHIALQDHGDRVRYRDIKLRRL